MIFRRARPEHAHVVLDLLVGDAEVIRRAALGGDAQFVEDFLGRIVGEMLFRAEPLGDFQQDAGVGARIARRIHRLADAHDATLGRGDRAVFLLVKRTGQNEIGVAGGFVEEEINADVVFQFLQRLADHVVVRQRDERVEADADQPLDLAAMNRLHDFVGGESFAGHVLFVNAPHLADVFAMLGILDVAVARKLVALVAVFASALAVTLTGDGGVAAVRFADASGGEHEIDAGQHVLDAFALVFDAARVQQKTGLRRPPPLRRLQNFLLRNARGALGPIEVVGLHGFLGFLETARVVGDELVVEPVVLDELMQDRTVERGIAARTDRQMQISGAGDRREARIDHDELGAVVARLPDPMRQRRESFADVGARKS